MDFDSWTKAIAREVKKEAEKEMQDEFKQIVVLYAEMFNEAILREWDSYMDSYTPKEYERTGKLQDKFTLLDQTILALLVEIGELANATRCLDQTQEHLLLHL